MHPGIGVVFQWLKALEVEVPALQLIFELFDFAAFHSLREAKQLAEFSLTVGQCPRNLFAKSQFVNQVVLAASKLVPSIATRSCGKASMASESSTSRLTLKKPSD